MSKIMRELYAEARGSRDAAGRVNEGARVKPSPPDATDASGTEWWKAQCEKAEGSLVNKVIETVVQAVQHPSIPEDHVKWWQERMLRQVNVE